MGPFRRRRLLWLVGFSVLLFACESGEQRAARPNLVLIVIDSLRADHVGAYGYPLPTTPVIDDLARTGLRFETAVSQSSWTLPSLMSLFTARHPPDLPGNVHDIRRSFGLDEAETTLAERLRSAGYRTISVATNPYNVDEIFRLMQGFDEKTFETSASASWVVDQALGKLTAMQAAGEQGPFFLYLHLMDVHTPYSPPPPYAELFATRDGNGPDASHGDPRGATDADELATPEFEQRRDHSVALYDGALRFADAEIGRLLDFFATAGLSDSTVVTIASDHGEAFWDRVELEQALGLNAHGQPGRFGVGHGHTLFQELVAVPLILNGPGVEAGVAAGPVRNLDIAPTLLGLAGVPVGPTETDGSDLLHRDGIAAPGALSETRLADRHHLSLVTERHQVVRIDADEILFGTGTGVWKRANPGDETRARLSRDLDARLESMRRARFREGYIDPKTVEALRALGYVQ